MRTYASFLAALLLALAGAAQAASPAVYEAPTFTAAVLADGLENPWEMVWGPDDHLWVTERTGKRVTRVDPRTGEKKTALTIDEALTGNQQGVLGLALAPDFMRLNGSRHVYVVHTYQADERPFMKIQRYAYDPETQTLGGASVVMDRLPAGDDHNAGRLIFGPDGKLYYSHGEHGHNQNANFCKPIEAQRLPTAEEVRDRNWSSYVGKVMRLNTDGTIPEDNPVLNGVKSHVFTYGHRNPQGLVFADGHLYSCEHGPSTDDEVNRLVAGGNYGWPHVAGYRDDQAYVHAEWSKAGDCASLTYDANVIPEGVPVHKESDWQEDFVEPLKTFYTVPNDYDFHAQDCGGYICWPTVAPSSIAYYPKDGAIAAWRDSLVISTLKSGALYRMRLSSDRKTVQGDVVREFKTANRYRVVLVSPDTRTLYVATDVEGAARDVNDRPTKNIANPGAILAFTYTGE